MIVVVSASGDSFDVIERPEFASTSTPVEFSVVGRSSQWAKLARETVEQHPYCACCRAERDLQVHHLMPYSLFPELELRPDNLLVLCRRCHLFVGHLGYWGAWNPTAKWDATMWRARIDTRPTSEGGS